MLAVGVGKEGFHNTTWDGSSLDCVETERKHQLDDSPIGMEATLGGCVMDSPHKRKGCTMLFRDSAMNHVEAKEVQARLRSDRTEIH